VTAKSVSSIDWIHAIRDSKDLVEAAEAQKHLGEIGHDDAVRYVRPQTVKHVALAYGSFMGRDGVARVGVATIAERFGLAPRTVQRARLLLASTGWLIVEPGGRGARDVCICRAQIPSTATYFKSRSASPGRSARAGSRSPGPASASPGPAKSGEEKPPLRGGAVVCEVRRVPARENDEEHRQRMLDLLREPQLFATNRGAYEGADT
jgi:hypothetical protein